MKRYDQCDDTCTTDCGHCKGKGRPVDPCPQCRGTTSHKLACTDERAVAWRKERASFSFVTREIERRAREGESSP